MFIKVRWCSEVQIADRVQYVMWVSGWGGGGMMSDGGGGGGVRRSWRGMWSSVREGWLKTKAERARGYGRVGSDKLEYYSSLSTTTITHLWWI